MQLTNSLVTICCNSVLAHLGGDVYISVMTIISSIRQIVETPIYAITEGSSPILSYNYGAKRSEKVKKCGIEMAFLVLLYTGIAWSVILFAPRFLISIFSSDQSLASHTIPALKHISLHSSLWIYSISDRPFSNHSTKRSRQFSFHFFEKC